MQILLWYWGRRGGRAQYALGLAQALTGRPGVERSLSVSAQGEFRDRFRNLSDPTDILDTYRDLSGFATGLLRLPALTRQLAGRARQGDVVVLSGRRSWRLPWPGPGPPASRWCTTPRRIRVISAGPGIGATAVTAPALADPLAVLMDPARLAALRREAVRAGAAASDRDAAATALLAGLARVLR